MLVQYEGHIARAEVLFLENIWRQRCRDACHVHVRMCFAHDLPYDLADAIARYMWFPLRPKEARPVDPALYDMRGG